jgi:hypothetical protein
MPSPNRTNHARLFVTGATARIVAHGFAYDSKGGLGRRMGRDQEQDDPLGEVKVFLRNRLSPEDFSRLEMMLKALAGGSEDDTKPDAVRDYERSQKYNEGGQDDPPPFEGRPRTGGKVDWDEEVTPHLLPHSGPNLSPEYREEFPRIGGKDRFGGAHDARGGYFDMFPNNARVTFGYGH